MRLARAAGLPTAPVRLAHVPEPVLEVERFDREVMAARVRRLHVIDGCQALGLSAGFKYERPYGNGVDVRNIRDGASLPALFRFLEQSRNPAAQRLQLLRWVIFQVLIGNTDAHAKNLSFFSSGAGFALAPAYDLVSTLAFDHARLEQTYAMAIGDAFLDDELSPYEWAHFAVNCGLSPRLVATELRKMADKIMTRIDATAIEARSEGGNTMVIDAVSAVVRRLCVRHRGMTRDIARVSPDLF